MACKYGCNKNCSHNCHDNQLYLKACSWVVKFPSVTADLLCASIAICILEKYMWTKGRRRINNKYLVVTLFNHESEKNKKIREIFEIFSWTIFERILKKQNSITYVSKYNFNFYDHMGYCDDPLRGRSKILIIMIAHIFMERPITALSYFSSIFILIIIISEDEPTSFSFCIVFFTELSCSSK